MEKADLTAFVTRRLCEADNPQDIILDVCQKTGWYWPDAEAFVRRVQEMKAPEITKRQFPLLTVLALGIFLAGLGLTFFGVYSIVDSWNQLSQARDYLLRVKLPIVDIYGIYINIYLMPIAPIFTGTAMMLGSLLGMRDIWSRLLFR
jgi:hypothetical protein